jgi:hypothetical protein
VRAGDGNGLFLYICIKISMMRILVTEGVAEMVPPGVDAKECA